ncbi:MAG: ABC transporter substrate-binding protein [Spirochaetaceae bacterium]|jgi:polar amino acid transport system substrate-binding protein|nr:ABC transporter substrate-binding protein [Spirochaetaceae bacterium]
MKKFMFVTIAALTVFSYSAFAGGGKQSAEQGGLTLEKGVLSIGMEIGYPPFEYYDIDGKTPIGFDVELGKALAERLGLTPKFIDTAWDGIFAGVDANKYDCIISAVTITDERKEVFNFTQPYISSVQSIVMLKDSPVNIEKPEDLAGLRVTYQAETVSDIYVDKLIADGVKITAFEYDKVINCFDELKIGRVDAIMCDSPVAFYYVNTPDSPFEVVWQGDAEEQFGICLKKGNNDLTIKLDTALDEMFLDGTMQKLSEDIFNVDMVSVVKK